MAICSVSSAYRCTQAANIFHAHAEIKFQMNVKLRKPFLEQNLSLEKPKKTKSGKMWGHSRTLSRVEALGMVRFDQNTGIFRVKINLTD